MVHRRRIDLVAAATPNRLSLQQDSSLHLIPLQFFHTYYSFFYPPGGIVPEDCGMGNTMYTLTTYKNFLRYPTWLLKHTPFF